MPETHQSVSELSRALTRGERVACIHYACESFYDVHDRPLAISAIGITELTDRSGNGRTEVFSIANSAPNDDPVEREKEMLHRFFAAARLIPDARWVHWNMNKASFGFPAIMARYRFLLGEDAPAVFIEDRLHDLDSMIESRYGHEFARHPKMRNLFSLNGYYMPFFKDGREEVAAFSSGDFKACENSAGEKSGLLAAALAAFIRGDLQTSTSVGRLPFADGELDAVEVVYKLGEKMLLVERELSHRHDSRSTLTVTDEYDSQDLFRSLLRIFFDDVRPEVVSPQYAGGSSRVDFVLPEYELAVELKFTRNSLPDRKLGEELIIDRDRYSTLGEVRHLVCLVFDHTGILRNPRGLEKDLVREASKDEFAVTVRIFDR
ncbi:hypothetical protein [Plantibacter flavus]|uniref:PD-(D/E)XK nuclease domain-containing protein n=1 Tax=Plantibacter flavus TaxID=150123 RepID=UPI001960FEF7|nr:hypothetical protein [Plantibacter flavus]